MSSSNYSLPRPPSSKVPDARFRGDDFDRGGGETCQESKPKGKDAKGRFLGKMTKMASWMTTSEPSVQALKQHKKVTFEKAGLTFDDPRANAKLHAPIGQLPADAIRPAGRGPDPEEVFKKKSEKVRARHSYMGSTGSGMSRISSSGSSEASSVRTTSYKDPFSFK